MNPADRRISGRVSGGKGSVNVISAAYEVRSTKGGQKKPDSCQKAEWMGRGGGMGERGNDAFFPAK